MADNEEENVANAWEELLAFLFEGERIEWIVFGDWLGKFSGGESDPGYVPKDKQGVLLDAGDAEPLMKGWTLRTFGSESRAYAIQVWTDQRILRSHVLGHNSVYQVMYSLPRHPKSFDVTSTLPQMWPKYPLGQDVT